MFTLLHQPVLQGTWALLTNSLLWASPSSTSGRVKGSLQSPRSPLDLQVKHLLCSELVLSCSWLTTLKRSVRPRHVNVILPAQHHRGGHGRHHQRENHLSLVSPLQTGCAGGTVVVCRAAGRQMSTVLCAPLHLALGALGSSVSSLRASHSTQSRQSRQSSSGQTQNVAFIGQIQPDIAVQFLLFDFKQQVRWITTH